MDIICPPLNNIYFIKNITMSKKTKKVIRLTESEMVDLIEGIVNQVKSTKRKAIQESRSKRPITRRK